MTSGKVNARGAAKIDLPRVPRSIPTDSGKVVLEIVSEVQAPSNGTGLPPSGSHRK